MISVPVNDYIAKISLLEARRGAATSYRLLEPFGVAARDQLGMQKAAEKIARFVGLDGFGFDVSVSKLERNVGGHISLHYSMPNASIEISEETATFPEAILATLSHEIAHKYLHHHGISSGSGLAYQYENEVLTDITAVFLGLGKLMLNGSELKRIYVEEDAYSTQTTTHTLKSGYLNREQLAFVYLLVCSMRGVEESISERFLTEESQSAIVAMKRAYSHYFDGRYLQDNIRESILRRLKDEIAGVQSAVSAVDRSIDSLNQRLLEPVQSFRLKSRKLLDEQSLFADVSLVDEELDPCLRYLNAILLDIRTTESVNNLRSLVSQTVSIAKSLRPLNKFLRRLPDHFPDSDKRSVISRIGNLFSPRQKL